MTFIEKVIIVVAFLSVAYTWEFDDNQEYQWKCVTDYECMIEEHKCMKENKC